MLEDIKYAFSDYELSVLSSIVQVGDSAYNDLMHTESAMFKHPYFADTHGRIRTKLVQMQCELESHDSKFPFVFSQRHFPYSQCIPELKNKNIILHIGRSTASDVLPAVSKYKILLSNNNSPLFRQLVFEANMTPPIGLDPFYGILTFGGVHKPFLTIQFPKPGYTGIADYIDIPILTAKTEALETFERKKAKLKNEFLAKDLEEAIS